MQADFAEQGVMTNVVSVGCVCRAIFGPLFATFKTNHRLAFRCMNIYQMASLVVGLVPYQIGIPEYSEPLGENPTHLCKRFPLHLYSHSDYFFSTHTLIISTVQKVDFNM